MGKYVVLYRSTATAAEQMASGTPEQAAAAMQLWTDWAEFLQIPGMDG